MADDLKDRGQRDRDRINMSEDFEARYWSEKFGVSKERLQAAVDKVGLMARDVARELGKSL
jgi:hypothetical protein